ncbi:phenoloxidase 2-like [Onthophagus taurus]|uniref:phenoloxidase 2-like n=1 Tax=Onthophagus taurus TaxID=166361 RepID=UPI0039BDB5CB
MATDKLLLLFDKPLEPSFAKKGGNKTIEVPVDYLTDRYKEIAPTLANRIGEDSDEIVQVNQVPHPDLKDVLELGRRENFSLFLPKHKAMAAKLIDIFLKAKNVDEFFSLAVYSRERVNPYLFIYAYSVAILHRKDTKHIKIPNNIQTFPDKFFDSKVFGEVRESAAIVPQGSRIPIEMPLDYTASDLELEHRLAYWREDLGLNLHHWHWHLVYPGSGPPEVVRKDRRGELFYYMHQQIIGRYNVERLCNNMRRVERLTDWQTGLNEAYFPKIDSLVASRAYPARVKDQKMRDVNRRELNVDVEDIVRWRDRMYQAIDQGYVTNTQGQRVNLTEFEGIDILGDMMEPSDLSPNPQLYGSLHGMGHMIIAYIHDPQGKHLEPFTVMGDFNTAMRDPIFYRWHAFVDDVFQRFKGTIPRYTREQLDFPNVSVTDMNVKTPSGSTNQLNTFWQQSDVDFSNGVDFIGSGSVFVRFTHLQHEPFTYNITVNNTTGSNRMGTCRIFLGPKTDERGNPLLLNNQRLMFMEMDRFTVNLKQGQSTIVRNSTQSSVTIPFENSFRDLNRPAGVSQDQFNFCGCGWPHHLLVPKGKPEGYPMQLFVMISDYEQDKVDQPATDDAVECDDASSYCGLRNKKYPDKRSMGYPFDRVPRQGAETLPKFLTPNMRVQDVLINHANRTVRPRSNN